ncbi:ROK family protein [Corynebacterium sp. 335C]
MPAASPHDAPTIGFDIGGTNLRGAVVAPGGRILRTAKRPTPATEEGMEDAIHAIVDELRAHHPDAASVGLAVAGFLDPGCRIVRFAPHLPWRDADVATRLERRLGMPVVLEHDANSAAWGEYRHGAARDAGTWVLFAIGTGIGGAMMHGGRLFRGAHGTAPEFGHLTVVPGGRPCPCGKRGCLERYCSGTALVTTAAELAPEYASRSPLARRLVRAGVSGPQVGGTEVMEAAAAGDPLGAAAVDDFATWLGRGLALVADVFDPELIVIGGGVARAADQYLGRAREVFAENITGSGHRPLARIAPAELGADAGVIGAADLAALGPDAPR